MAWLCSGRAAGPHQADWGSGDWAIARGVTARPSRRACGVARVLGVRHLVQAGLTAAALRAAEPGQSLPLGLGAAVDVLHATTMVGLALADQGARRVALADTGVEVALAAAG